MSVTPSLLIDKNGDVFALTGTDLAAANAVPVEIDGGLWAVTLDELELQPHSTTTLNPAVFPQWAGTTGDVVEGVLRVRGPLTNASITARDGSGVSFDVGLAADEYVFIDLATFTGWWGGSEDWEPTGNVVLLDYPAGGPLRVSPESVGLVLTMTGEGFVKGTTALTVKAEKFWL